MDDTGAITKLNATVMSDASAMLYNDVHFRPASTCDSWALFPLLLPELRLHVWQLLLQRHRMIDLVICTDDDEDSEARSTYYTGRNSLGNIAWQAALEYYRVRLPFPRQNGAQVLFLNPEYDVLDVRPARQSRGDGPRITTMGTHLALHRDYQQDENLKFLAEWGWVIPRHGMIVDAETFERLERAPSTAVGMWLFQPDAFKEPTNVQRSCFDVSAVHPGLLLFDCYYSSVIPAAGPAQKTNGTRLRTSCDACQNLKVKCSQDKPSCRRCSKNGLSCVYFPLRRMGRPKRPSVTPFSLPITTATPRSQSQACDNQRRRHATTTHSSASTMHPKATGHTPSGMEDLSGAGPSFGLENSDLGSDGLSSGGIVLGAEDDTLTGTYSATILEERPKIASIVNDELLSLSTGLDGSPALMRQQPGLLTSPLATLVGLSSHVGTKDQSSSSNDVQASREAGHCYLAILNRLTQLEATLDAGPRPPRLDVILSAERDTRQLKGRIFACRGHGIRELDMESSPTAPRERIPQGCIDAHGSSLLVLSLLADRVTSLFEDLFRRAAVSSHSMDQATRRTTASWLHGSLPEFTSQAGERQYERSVRSSFPRDIHCPVPEANCELTIGNYEVVAY
ncbi:hypothetical protein VMCG_08890 [Cytospora schulzeri]|uniref:Zn(2)-C6 fungal-type domain-containing protein n=1 Tax=Cytospora schulzeri TaxID=448051 RepID=A0A423VUN6_9PEZI|nr:hypothetical protein VMCG_08890 [Valsa malicola]